MRIFNTVQELWSYCLFCPICKEPSRTITLQVGPDDQFKLSRNIPYEKNDSHLKLFCSFRIDRDDPDYIKGNCSATFEININTNEYALSVGGNPSLMEKANQAYFYFYVHADCKKCGNSYVNSSDLEFDRDLKRVTHIQMEREGYYLLTEKDKYHITQSHDRNILMVSLIETPEAGERIDHESVLELPFVKLDFSDIPKVVNKIKTLILFS
jgi:hypothetical protein